MNLKQFTEENLKINKISRDMFNPIISILNKE